MTQNSSPSAAQSVLQKRELALVFAIALVARAGWGIIRMQAGGDPARLEFPDEVQYWHMALSLANGQGLVDDMGFRATRMPLYPAFLSMFALSPSGVVLARVAQWFVGAMAAPLVASMSRRWLSHRGALAAGMVVALDPFLVFFSSLLLTETLTITALCLLWWMLAGALACTRDVRGSWWGIAVASSLCVYLRESNLGLVVVVLFVVAATRRSFRLLFKAALVLACVAVALFPWAVRNSTVLGEWCWLTTRAGISLYDGVGPQATGASDLAPVQRTGTAAALGETEWNRYFRKASWESIQNNPGRVARLAAIKMARMWNPVPNVDTYQSDRVRYISAAWSVPLFGLAVAGTLRGALSGSRHLRWAVLFLLLPALYFSVLHSVYVGSVRYRLPAVPMIAVLSAMAIAVRKNSEHERPDEGATTFSQSTQPIRQ